MSSNAELMKQYIDAASLAHPSAQLDEGVFQAIKSWISGLGDAVKKDGKATLLKFETFLKHRYGARVTQQVKSANKSWMWSKATYNDLYVFSTEYLSVDQVDLDRALKNPIVTNNIKKIIATLPSGISPPQLPLSSSTIRSNNNPISPTIEADSKDYPSKAISAAIIDGIVHAIHLKRAKSGQPAEPTSTPHTALDSNDIKTTVSSDTPLNTEEDIKAVILSIKQGLSTLKGTP